MGFFSKIWHALTGWLKPDVANNNGFNLEKQGTNNPIPVIYGEYKQAPCIKVLKVSSDKQGGAKNEYLHLVCVFCEGEIDSIGTLYFNGIPETQIPNERYYLERYTGTDTQLASSTLTNEVNGWNATAKLSGIAYVYVRLKIDKKSEWWQGEPEITGDIKGKKVFDPRTSTTAFSNNAALCFYDFFINARYGKATALTKIDTQSFIADANYVETTRTYKRTIYQTEFDDAARRWIKIPVGIVNETVTENLFSCNALLDTSKKVKENLDELRKGMRAILPESNGKHRIVIEKEGSPVYAFTQDNLIGGISISGGDLNNRYNQVIVKFRNYLTGEQDEAYYPVASALKSTWLAEDNNKPLLDEFTFDTINNKAEALQMATVIALRSRQQLAVKFNGMPETFVVEVGDIVTLNSTIAGFTAKPFRIEHATLNIDTGEIVFQAIEHQNTIYPWSVTDVTEEYVDTSLALPTSINAPKNVIFSKYSDDKDAMGILSWDDPNDNMVSSYIVEVKDIATDTLQWSRETTNTYINIARLTKDSYSAKVSAKNALYTSSPTSIILTSSAPKVPDGLLVNAGNFELVLTPTFGGVSGNILCECKGSDTNDIATAASLGRDISFIDNNLLPLKTRYYWLKAINSAGESIWSTAFTGKTLKDDTGLNQVISGLTASNFDANVNNLLDQVGNIGGTDPLPVVIDNILNDVGGLQNVEATVFDEYKKVATDAVVQVTASALRDLQFAEDRNQIESWKLQVDANLQTLTLNAGTILPNEWSSYKLQVDGNAGTLTSISTKQTEQDGVLTTHTSKIQQSSDRLTFLEQSTAFGDNVAQFNSLQLQLDSQNNTINQQALSLRVKDVDLINQILTGSLTESDLASLDVDFSIAKQNISALTDDTQALATSNSTLLSQFNTNQTSLIQTEKTLSNAISAQVTDKTLLIASINTETGARTAEISRVDQAVAGESTARATAITSINAAINTETSSRQAEISRVDQAVAGESTARATAITSINAAINTETSSRQAEISRVDQAIVDEASNRLTAVSSLSAKVTTTEQGIASANLAISANSDGINGLKAQVFLGLDINGRVTGIYINGSATQTNIEFSADKISLVNPNTGLTDLNYNALAQQLEFAGDISSASSTYTDPTHTTLMNQNGFVIWHGMSVNANAPSLANAIWFLDKNGNYKKDISRTKATQSTWNELFTLSPVREHYVIGLLGVELSFYLDIQLNDIDGGAGTSHITANHKGKIVVTVVFFANNTSIGTVSKSYQYGGYDSYVAVDDLSESRTSLNASSLFSLDHAPSLFTKVTYAAQVTIADTSNFISSALSKKLYAKFTTLEIS